MKWVAAAIFILFGIAGRAETLLVGRTRLPIALSTLVVTALVGYVVVRCTGGYSWSDTSPFWS